MGTEEIGSLVHFLMDGSKETDDFQLFSLRETRPLGFRSSALTGVEHRALLVGKESVALAGHLSVEAKLPTMA
jgi:hypothetical protein